MFHRSWWPSARQGRCGDSSGDLLREFTFRGVGSVSLFFLAHVKIARCIAAAKINWNRSCIERVRRFCGGVRAVNGHKRQPGSLYIHRIRIQLFLRVRDHIGRRGAVGARNAGTEQSGIGAVLSELDGFAVALWRSLIAISLRREVSKNETLLYQMGVHFKR